MIWMHKFVQEQEAHVYVYSIQQHNKRDTIFFRNAVFIEFVSLNTKN